MPFIQRVTLGLPAMITGECWGMQGGPLLRAPRHYEGTGLIMGCPSPKTQGLTGTTRSTLIRVFLRISLEKPRGGPLPHTPFVIRKSCPGPQRATALRSPHAGESHSWILLVAGGRFSKDPNGLPPSHNPVINPVHLQGPSCTRVLQQAPGAEVRPKREEILETGLQIA